LSDDEPGLSAIVLGQVNRAPGTDGYVTVAEISAMTLAADLVTISACDSGAGVADQGEGVLGMAYGLFQAGASATLLTLWPVADKHTATLMTRFYSEIPKSKSLQEALAKAKRWALANSIPESVVSAFVLQGA
jgi:CHAT domain-containing protein